MYGGDGALFLWWCPAKRQESGLIRVKVISVPAVVPSFTHNPSALQAAHMSLHTEYHVIVFDEIQSSPLPQSTSWPVGSHSNAPLGKTNALVSRLHLKAVFYYNDLP